MNDITMFSVENSFNERSGSDLGYNGFPVSLNYFTALPDSTILHNPNVTIIFKSLLKKDSITKEKSLNDFIQLLDDHDNEQLVIDELLILSWIQLYAKLAIDNSRSVRILSHQTQSKLLGVVGGKAFSKYLVSSIPIWVQGIYDNDKLVSISTYKTLLHSFQDNKERVDSKIWITFYEPIINYSATVINLENHKSLSDQRYTKETDSFAKYERVLNGSVMMLNKVISLINDREIKVEKRDKEVERIEELLNLDVLWDYLGSSISIDTLNLPLFKSLLILIRSIFGNVSTEGNIEPNEIIKNLDNAKALYKLVSKKFIKHIKLKPSKKGQNNDIIYSNIILQFWDSMISLTSFSLLPSSQRKSLKIKKNFWELGGNKSRSRLLEYLKLGSCLLNPIYYVVIGQFFQTLSQVVSDMDNNNEGFIHFNNIEDADLIINEILCSQFKNLSNFEYKEKCFNCILKTYEIFNQNISQDSIQLVNTLRNVIYHVLDTGSYKGIRNQTPNKLQNLLNSFGNFVNKNFSDKSVEILLRDINSKVLALVTSGNEQKLVLDNFEFKLPVMDVITNYFNLLTNLANDSAKTFIDMLIVNICKSVEEGTITSEAIIAFHIIVLFINSNLDKPDRIVSNIKSFIGNLPSFIEPQFIETPIKVFSSFLGSNCNNGNGIDLKEIVSDFFFKICMVDKSKIPLLLSVVCLSKGFDKFNIKEDFTDIYQYLLELSRKENLSEEEARIIFNYTNDQEILKNLINTSNASNEEGLKFIDYFLKYSNIDNLNLENENLEFYGNLFLICWSNIDNSIYQNFLAVFAKKFPSKIFTESLYQFTAQSSVETDFSSATKYLLNLSESPKNVFELLPLEKYFNVVAETVEHMNIDLLAIANPLEQNIFLVKADSKRNFQLDLSLLAIGKFLFEFSDHLDSIESNEISINILVTSGIIAEYIHDYFFLHNDDMRLSSLDCQILSIRTGLLTMFKNNVNGISLSSLMPIINNDESKNNDYSLCLLVFSRLNKEITEGSHNHPNFQIYYARLMKIYLDTLVELETIQSFEAAITINFNRLLSFPLKLSVILLSLSRFFFQSNKFDRIRNYLAAEILGVKSDTQILDDGLKWLTLIINFFNTDIHELEKFEVIPSHRLAMILNQLSKWLESDISYNESFISVRCQIARFLNGLIYSNSKILPDKFWDLAVHLCLDNLGISQAEPKHLELQYFTLKLFISLNKAQKYPTEDWNENKDSLHEEILDLIVNDSNHLLDLNLNNQPVYLCHELLKRICNNYTFSNKLLNDKLTGLYSLLSNSKFIGLQRIGALLLHELILTNQQDFVVEYQLQKSNLVNSDDLDDGEGEFKAEIPKGLIELIQPIDDTFADSIELEGSGDVSKALWSWYLIFDHFKDITYSIRSEYVSQLKAGGYIDKLLSLIFELVDIANSNVILKKLHTSENSNSKIKPSDNLLQEYDISLGIVGETFKFELKFLLLHLYYLSFQYLGSYVQAWFNSIRDRQLKQKIEKFSIKYVSPLIVHKILEDVSKSKDKLTNKDENMSIKVSSVTNEIKSVYLIDEQTMEMVIKIPDSYPLSNVSVEGPLRIGVKENQWKAWLLASQRIISLTNGSIIESIELFNRNVNLHFSGFEDCAICYSILHQDHSLPSKTCPTCLNKFHAACLYKWFKSSGASTCPLCRSAFNFRTPKSVV